MKILQRTRLRARRAAASLTRALSGSAYAGLASRLARLPACDVSVHMLSQSDRVDASWMSYASLCIYSGRRYPLWIHDDGSFGEEDVARLRRSLPGAVFVSRRQADAEMCGRLRGAPECAKFRDENFFFLKLFDAFHFAPSERFIVLDNDILFFREPREVARWIDLREREICFNSERGESLAMSREDLATLPGRPANMLLNAGFGLIWREVMDWEFCERFLARCRENIHLVQKIHLMEQTTWAFLIGQSPLPLRLLPPAYEISNDVLKSRETIMRHYTGFTKHDIMFVEAFLGLPGLLRRALL
jgi:hypothetical protein